MFQFIKEERNIKHWFLGSCLMILFYIFFNNKPEAFPYGNEVMNVSFGLSLAIITNTIFYYLQVYIPNLKLKAIAQKDVNYLVNVNLDDMFWSIFVYNSTPKSFFMKKASNHDIYHDKYAKMICSNIKLNTIKPRSKKTWEEFIKEGVDRFNNEYEKLKIKYPNVVSLETLENLEKIHRNYIFTSFRENIPITPINNEAHLYT